MKKLLFFLLLSSAIAPVAINAAAQAQGPQISDFYSGLATLLQKREKLTRDLGLVNLKPSQKANLHAQIEDNRKRVASIIRSLELRGISKVEIIAEMNQRLSPGQFAHLHAFLAEPAAGAAPVPVAVVDPSDSYSESD